MKSLSISARLWMPVIVLAIFVVLMTTVASSRTQGLIAKAQAAQHEQQHKIEMALRWRGLVETQGARLAAAGEAGLPEAAKAEAQANASESADLQKQLEALSTDSEEKSLLDKIKRAHEDYSAGKSSAQLKTYLDAQQVFIKLQLDKSDRLREAAGAERMRTVWMVALVMGLIVLGLAVATRFLVKAISQPLHLLAQQAERIGSGDFSSPIAHDRQDEIGAMQAALGAMQDALNRVVGEVRRSADSIQTASTEIASGNLDLSQRTEQTASNLQQAASAIGQLTGAVHQSADSASTANQLASTAAQVAQRGGQVVGQVVATMEEINSSSKRINDIIGVIDGIAFQTNILALNAAVEAARAGEQGRGFAVVASEVRSLAQRSAEAAKEIKALIGVSVDKVEAGTRLVQDAGSTMDEIVASVGKVTDIIGEIRASTVEQSSGISSVNGSVGQLDQMTQQNAALVEESAAAAESLRDQASKLAGLVSEFKLQGASYAGPAGSNSYKRPAAAPEKKGHASALKPAPKAAQPNDAQSAPVAKAKIPAQAPVRARSPKPSAASETAGNDGDWETF
ncbi:methyl-accepting chemotaxis protein [Paucibacter sp. Y2R2-4]|uniref:methyl-accepting chemotaxis protein n=1 Tax=Paucibacter sp. Y2R2-4 TaxID=2893553 RepID=UPI0029621AE0|nr:methyl-accepting chemotaxis protein [Paucibacter sp. Y2R2-4]